jgi:LDH2 family malate/lactate/ureidoglycolate dehydrogenase
VLPFVTPACSCHEAEKQLGQELAIGAMNAALGGIVPGIYRHEDPAKQWQPEPLDTERWIANQGSMHIVIDACKLLPIVALHDQMDHFISTAQRMQPLPGNKNAFLPGGREDMFRREYQAEGIGLTLAHAQTLQEIADRLRMSFPWSRQPAHADAKYAALSQPPQLAKL